MILFLFTVGDSLPGSCFPGCSFLFSFSPQGHRVSSFLLFPLSLRLLTGFPGHRVSSFLLFPLPIGLLTGSPGHRVSSFLLFPLPLRLVISSPGHRVSSFFFIPLPLRLLTGFPGHRVSLSAVLRRRIRPKGHRREEAARHILRPEQHVLPELQAQPS